jgi:Tol biopolymer transport system component
MALSASHAQAKVPGPNGRIAFSRYVQDDNTVTYTVNPDGSHMQQLFPGFSGGPRWSPDGSQVSLIYTANADGSGLQQVTGSPTFDRDGDWGPHPLAT